MLNKNKGKFFEDWITQSNKVYNARGLAVINKIPTPWQVARKYSPMNKTYNIATAYPLEKSTVDFGGTAASKSIWFEAKTCRNKTSFPLINIHKHQMDYLESVHKQGGEAFFLIFSVHEMKTWLLWINQLLEFIATEKRKSIPYTWFDANCAVIKQNNGVMLDYLPEVLKPSKGH